MLGILATGTPVDAVIAAVESAEGMATAVMAGAGGIMVTLAIIGGLWTLGRRWAGRAARGG